MIKNIEIQNFKIYEGREIIPLSSINLLTGINGKGKSTTLQSLLLMGQSAIHNRASNKILLNGLNVHLGNVDDVKNIYCPKDQPTILKYCYDNLSIEYSLHSSDLTLQELEINAISVSGEFDGKKIHFELVKESESSYFYSLNNSVNIEKDLLEERFLLFDLFIDNTILKGREKSSLYYAKEIFNLNYIHYTSADRGGPRSYYETTNLGHFITVGAFGENTVSVLHKLGSELVNEKLLALTCVFFDLDPETTVKTIISITNIWLEFIFKGANVHVDSVPGEEILKLRFQSVEGRSFKATNVGYGFSYCLPIIVTGLISKPGEIIVVENPEAHLHPYAQSLLTKFLALVSKVGVQVFIESHSDHVLNALRVCVHDKILDSEDCNILYFNQEDKKSFVKIPIDERGGIDKWPRDFFEQATNDLNHLHGF